MPVIEEEILNKDISLTIASKLLKFRMHVHEGHSERSVTQNYFYLGPILCMQSRKKGSKK